MNDDFTIDVILNRKRYEMIYMFGYLLLIISLSLTYIILMHKYQTYYYSYGKIINNELEISIYLDDIEYLKNNTYLEIDNQKYSYEISHVSKLYIDNNYRNYLYAYLKVDNLPCIDNYVYKIKIIKANKRLVEYIDDNL